MKPQIDFQIIETYDPRRILVSDFSEWEHLDKEQSSLEVVTPDGNTVVLPFKKFAMNGLNSVNLGIGCADDGSFLDLPDGIYKITLLSCNDKFFKTRHYLQSDIAQGKLDKLFTMVDYDCKNVDKDRRDKLLTLDYLMKTSKAATRKGDLTLAENFFECALETLDSYLRCDNCF